MLFKRLFHLFIKPNLTILTLVFVTIIVVANPTICQVSQNVLTGSHAPVGRNIYTCRISYEGKDPVSKDIRRDLMPEQLFTFTDGKLKSSLPERDFIVCSGSLTSISGGFRSLVLYLKLASLNAKKTYGGLARGSPLTINLVNGKEITLFNQRNDPGVLNPDSGETSYTGIYRIDVQAEKMLTKSEVDQMRIVWTSGFENYDLHNVDFFINQFNCLNKTK